jgi:sugar phosphate isomerase/epimerase
MNELPAIDRLRQAMRNASVDDVEEALEAAEELGRQAVAVALETPTPAQQPRRFEPTEEEERQRLLDAALADAIEMVNRHRMRLGRRVCSRPDGTVTRLIYEHLRGMAGADGGSDNDPSFQ